MSHAKTALADRKMVGRAIKDSFIKLNPKIQKDNPVMLMVYISAILTIGLWVVSLFGIKDAPSGFTLAIAIILWFTVLFANFAEVIAEGRGKAQADSLRASKHDVEAHKIPSADKKDSVTAVPSAALRKGDIVIVCAGEQIPSDGEVIEGAASVDESAITGESAPVIRESGGDRSAVTGGTTVLSDRIVVRVTNDPGESFLDKMIAMVEGAARKKTPNEIALQIFLVALSIIFILVTVSLYTYSIFSAKQAGIENPTSITTLVALLVCLAPTTIGALLSAIGIAGMSRLMVAVGIGTGVGANVLTAQKLGMGDKEGANKAAGNAAFLALLIYILFLIFGFFGAGAYISSQTSTPEIAEMGTEYLRICCIFSFGMSFFSVYEKLLQSTGHSLCSTIAQISGAVTNIILDPILIYGLLGFPEMGVSGAAYATVIGQIVSFAVALVFHINVNTSLSNKLCYFRPSLRTIKAIYSVGLPAIISQALISAMTYGLNLIFGGISEAMVTAYGLFYKIQQFLLFAAFGMRDAIMPITAFVYGMMNKGRIHDSVKYGQLYTAIIMLAGTILIEIFAVPFSEIFGLSGDTQALCVSAMRIISVSFIFAGVNIAFQGVFQAMVGGISSLIISFCRQIIFVFPFAIVFADIAKNNYEMTWLSWATFPVAELLTAVIAALLFRRIWHKNITKI